MKNERPPREVGSNLRLGPLPKARPLVERLREMSAHGYWPHLGDDAANEIERLRARVLELEAVHEDASGEVLAERERWRGRVRDHLRCTTMSIYGTHAECKAARDALERLLDDGA